MRAAWCTLHYMLLSKTATTAVLTWATAMSHSTVLAIAQRYGVTVPFSTLLRALQAQQKGNCFTIYAFSAHSLG
jgi:hypothetical protein